MKKNDALLFRPIDNTPIILWRMVLGLVFLFETWGAIGVGWVKQVYIDPPFFTFNFIGFEFLQPLPGYGMYVWFFILGLLAICMAVGYRYRLATVLFAIGWLGVYLMHKTSYNNHHYLMALLSCIMCFVPAHKAYSLDARHGRVSPSSQCYQAYLYLFLGLFLIVFTYAATAKIYPDWLRGTPLTQWLAAKKDSPIGFLYLGQYQPLIMAWGGILFDLLIIPAFLWKKTRKIAFIASLYFHLMNSITFQIGTFPYMMIGASVLFYPADKLRKWFRMSTIHPGELARPTAQGKRWMRVSILSFLLIQFILPLRHLAIPGNVYWTEEGHRLSWRMMLRSKSAHSYFDITTPDGAIKRNYPREHLSPKQYHTMSTRPDMIWQYCQYLKKLNGDSCHIKAHVNVSLNFRKAQPIVDPNYDMAKAEWHVFGHEEWITKGPEWEDE